MAKRWKTSQPSTQIKYAESSEWEEINPILEPGEPGYVSDTGVFKVGNGVDRFDELPLSGGGSPSSGSYITVVEHGSDPNYPRPSGVIVVYWLGSVEPVNAIEEDLWSGEVDVA